MLIRTTSILLFLLCAMVSPVLAQSDSDDDSFDNGEENENPFSMKPKFSRPSAGFGLAMGFGLTDLKPEVLDPSLGGDFIPTSFELYFITGGILVGGSWTTFDLYDPGDLYEQFTFDYAGVTLGYDHSLFYGRMSLRLSMMVGGGELTMVKRRPDITFDQALNPSGRQIFEEVRDQGFLMFRPAIGIGYAPIDFVQFRTGVGFMYPTSDESVDDLREPVFNFEVVLGPKR